MAILTVWRIIIAGALAAPAAGSQPDLLVLRQRVPDDGELDAGREVWSPRIDSHGARKSPLTLSSSARRDVVKRDKPGVSHPSMVYSSS